MKSKVKVGRLFDRLDQSYLNGLVVKARKGNSNAFAELFASVSGRQLYYLTMLYGSREKAVQTLPRVFTSVYRMLPLVPSLSKTDLFMPWLCRISALEYMKDAGPEAEGIDGHALSRILNLPLAESQIMLMNCIEGLSENEIAELMNVGPRTVRRFIKASRRHLTRNSGGREQELSLGSKESHKNAGASATELTTLETSEILDSVFSACGDEGNTIPMETISSYAVYRKERFTLQRVILAMALLVFMMLPLLFILPSYTVKIEETGIRGLPVYTVTVDSFLPVGKVLANIRDHELPVYEAGAKEFTVEPTRNGSMDISVELVNHQSVKTEYDVTAVDAEGPKLIDNKTIKDGFVLKVSDTGIGVDYREIYAVSASGKTYYPVSASEEDGVVFEYPTETWDIYIPDHIGNTLHLSVKLNK